MPIGTQTSSLLISSSSSRSESIAYQSTTNKLRTNSQQAAPSRSGQILVQTISPRLPPTPNTTTLLTQKHQGSTINIAKKRMIKATWEDWIAKLDAISKEDECHWRIETCPPHTLAPVARMENCASEVTHWATRIQLNRNVLNAYRPDRSRADRSHHLLETCPLPFPLPFCLYVCPLVISFPMNKNSIFPAALVLFLSGTVH